MSEIEQRYLRDIAGEMRNVSHSMRRDQVDRLARSVEISGISSELSTLGSSVSRLVSMTDRAIPSIAAELARNSTLLSSLLDVTLNPRKTAAREAAALGEQAMRNGWYDDAADEFEQALKSNRFDPVVLLNLGICRAADGAEDAAADAFERAVRYDLGKDYRPLGGRVACGAAIFAAEIHRRAGRYSSAIELVDSVRRAIPNCPEIDHTFANLTGDKESLRKALSAAPELALDASKRRTRHTETVSAEVLDDLRPELQQGIRLLEKLREVVGTKFRGQTDPRTPITDNGYAVELATTWSCLSDVILDLRGLNALATEEARRASERIELDISRQECISKEAEAAQERSHRSSHQSLLVLVCYGLLAALTAASCSAGWPQPGNDDSPGLAILGFVLFMGCVWASPAALVSVVELFRSLSQADDASHTISRTTTALHGLERSEERHDLYMLRFEPVSRAVEHFTGKHTSTRTIPFLGSVKVDWSDTRRIEG